jgi:GNAT superfamily N-acetyltransferase
MLFDIASSGYAIRPAAQSDAMPLRMLLPTITRIAASLVAVDGKHQLVVGAAAAMPQFRREPLPGPGVAVHVIEPCRKHGIGRSLIDQLAATARSAGAATLYAAERVEMNSAPMESWKSLGFEICQTVEHHRMELARFEPELQPLIDRVRQRGRIPERARMIPLYQADPQAVLQLHLDYLGGDTLNLSRRLRGEGRDGFLPQYSRVLVVDDVVRGCLLGHRGNADTMVIDANIVDATLRSGWAAVWLRLEAARGVRHLGIKNLEFTTFDHYADTRNFTKRLGGVTIGTSALMHRRIGL